jgi:hypothetical protein
MASIEKSTISINTLTAVIIGVISIVGNYYATRSAVETEMNEIKISVNDTHNALLIETGERKSADAMLELKVANNTGALVQYREKK